MSCSNIALDAIVRVATEKDATTTEVKLLSEGKGKDCFWAEVRIALAEIGLDSREVERVYSQLSSAAAPTLITDAVVYLPSLMATSIKLNSTSPLSVTVFCHGWREQGKKQILLSSVPCTAELKRSEAACISEDYEGKLREETIRYRIQEFYEDSFGVCLAAHGGDVSRRRFNILTPEFKTLVSDIESRVSRDLRFGCAEDWAISEEISCAEANIRGLICLQMLRVGDCACVYAEEPNDDTEGISGCVTAIGSDGIWLTTKAGEHIHMQVKDGLYDFEILSAVRESH